ncbi:MAG: SMI1/KNR4 family protein [Leptonema illini]|uniref:SMI1/KNR4 family protein n=1 Tax=Leptonema illini TaxID=183 RepID=A0A833GVW4_9LEPT|nr:MAG: SMI1/KNR4 family protein [Leptonema illini]
MKNELGKDFTKFEMNQPADRNSISEVESELHVVLPDDYVRFMQQFNGGEGPVGNENYLSLWRIEDLLPLNQAYEVEEFAPGLLLFASNGSDTAYGFDTTVETKPIVKIPFIGMSHTSKTLYANHFNEFLSLIALKC